MVSFVVDPHFYVPSGRADMSYNGHKETRYIGRTQHTMEAINSSESGWGAARTSLEWLWLSECISDVIWDHIRWNVNVWSCFICLLISSFKFRLILLWRVVGVKTQSIVIRHTVGLHKTNTRNRCNEASISNFCVWMLLTSTQTPHWRNETCAMPNDITHHRTTLPSEKKQAVVRM